MYQPRRIDIQLEEDEHPIGVQLHQPATALDLAMAELSLCGWGHYAVVKQHGHRLPRMLCFKRGPCTPLNTAGVHKPDLSLQTLLSLETGMHFLSSDL